MWIAILVVAGIVCLSLLGQFIPLGLMPAVIIGAVWYFGFRKTGSSHAADAPPPPQHGAPPTQLPRTAPLSPRVVDKPTLLSASDAAARAQGIAPMRSEESVATVLGDDDQLMAQAGQDSPEIVPYVRLIVGDGNPQWFGHG